MKLFEDYSLKNHNSFKIDVKARYFAEADTITDLIHFVKHKPLTQLPLIILGEGSNVLFKSDYNGVIIHPIIRGIEVIHEDGKHVIVKAGAGENWDAFVEWAINRHYGGIENLSLIPGSVGACPVQNIGAYGVEVSEVIESVETIDMTDGELKLYSKPECNFGYRTSIFKNELKGDKIITSVLFRLSRSPVLKTDYGEIRKKLKKYKDFDIRTLRTVIMEIRQEKLPDPAQIGNAGSFFKNPVITDEEFKKLVRIYPEIPGHPSDTPGQWKIPAAWLIEKCGWKDRCIGEAGTWSRQPLVLVNYGNSTGKQILELAESITRDVSEKFSIQLEKEVNVI
ncbi:MAG: hypothetical protein AMS27_12880 [Bacteroides sp. SM23_62_1]|nr:MAG: hypothetical protein AMS27_12880 [Bacteroides sp. SM23_62_1]